MLKLDRRRGRVGVPHGSGGGNGSEGRLFRRICGTEGRRVVRGYGDAACIRRRQQGRDHGRRLWLLLLLLVLGDDGAFQQLMWHLLIAGQSRSEIESRGRALRSRLLLRRYNSSHARRRRRCRASGRRSSLDTPVRISRR